MLFIHCLSSWSICKAHHALLARVAGLYLAFFFLFSPHPHRRLYCLVPVLCSSGTSSAVGQFIGYFMCRCDWTLSTEYTYNMFILRSCCRLERRGVSCLEDILATPDGRHLAAPWQVLALVFVIRSLSAQHKIINSFKIQRDNFNRLYITRIQPLDLAMNRFCPSRQARNYSVWNLMTNLRIYYCSSKKNWMGVHNGALQNRTLQNSSLHNGMLQNSNGSLHNSTGLLKGMW